jgi:hypothetical protein
MLHHPFQVSGLQSCNPPINPYPIRTRVTRFSYIPDPKAMRDARPRRELGRTYLIVLFSVLLPSHSNTSIPARK